MNVPERIKLRKRTSREEPYVGFFTYVNNGKIMSEKSWQSWGDIDAGEIDNLPVTGFKIVEDIRRSRGWFGSGRSVFRVLHPTCNTLFEITANNLIEIIDCTSIDRGEVLAPCVLAWEGAKVALLPVTSEEYQTATRVVLTDKTKTKEYKPGDIVVDSKNNEFTYLGHHTIEGYRLLQTKEEQRFILGHYDPRPDDSNIVYITKGHASRHLYLDSSNNLVALTSKKESQLITRSVETPNLNEIFATKQFVLQDRDTYGSDKLYSLFLYNTPSYNVEVFNEFQRLKKETEARIIAAIPDNHPEFAGKRFVKWNF